MRNVYLLRHADKDPKTGQLTDEGRMKARKLKETLGTFDMVITSDKNSRLLETAMLLTGISPKIDKRAGLVYDSVKQQELIKALAKTHPLNHAGVLYEYAEYESFATKVGKDLVALIAETLKMLPPDGRALIISQDPVLVAGERQLKGMPYQKIEASFQPLHGYVVDEHFGATNL